MYSFWRGVLAIISSAVLLTILNWLMIRDRPWNASDFWPMGLVLLMAIPSHRYEWVSTKQAAAPVGRTRCDLCGYRSRTAARTDCPTCGERLSREWIIRTGASQWACNLLFWTAFVLGWVIISFIELVAAARIYGSAAISKHPNTGYVLALLNLIVAHRLAGCVYTQTRWFRVWTAGSRCESCAYDLTGNVSGVCPECGAAIAQK